MEEWRTCTFDDLYSVSNIGRVRNNKRDRLRILSKNRNGYLTISFRHAGQRHTVHKLVTAAFIGPRPEHLQVNHKDGNKANNHIDNLEYITRSENSLHALALGLNQSGSKHTSSKLKDDEVREIRRLWADGNHSITNIAERYPVNMMAISEICSGKQWRWLDLDYAPPNRITKFTRHNSKLTESKVKEIWKMYNAGQPQTLIAKHFEVTTGAISHIITGRNYAWVEHE